MTDLVLADHASEWRRLKSLVDSVSSPITHRVYNLGLDEFFAWYTAEPRPGFTKATVAAWRVALEARGLGRFQLTSRSPPSASWRSRLRTTGCWPRSPGLAQQLNHPQGGSSASASHPGRNRC
jgi:hypothetical protein